jgi:predicted RND superfamily exporter protein
VNDTIGENDYFLIRKFLEEIPGEKKQSSELKNKALSNPLYYKSLISEDGRTAAIIVSVYDRPDDSGYRKRLIGKTKDILAKYQVLTGKVYMAGWTTTNLYLSQYMKKDIATFIPLTYLFITLAVYLFFRNIWLTLIAVLNISICMGSTMGLFSILDITLNNVTTIVPPVVMALALCDTVHIFFHLDENLLKRFKSKEKALSQALKKVILPCFLTSLTTAVGFLSLYSNKIDPIKDFALIASAGMIFEFVYSFLFLPSLILLFPAEKIFSIKTEQGKLTTFLGKINGFIQTRYVFICVLSLMIVLAAVFSSFKIKVDTNVLNYFKKGSELRTSTNFIEKNITGVRTIEISLTAGIENAFKDPQYLSYMEKLQLEMSLINGNDKTLSFIDFLKDMNESFHNENHEYRKIPQSKQLIAQYLLLYDSNEIDEFVNDSFDHARISLRINKHGTADHKIIMAKLKDIISQNTNNNISVQITGRVVQDINMIDDLVKGQISSLSIAAGVIAVMMFFVMKSFNLGVISIIPNFFPIILNFGIMGIAGIPLNAATALIAAVALGVAVDDTIHFLTAFRKNIEQKISISESIRFVILEKGRAILSSSLILTIGFSIMILSVFVPTIYFGLLSAVIMITAVMGDIFVLPAVVLLMKNNRTSGG